MRLNCDLGIGWNSTQLEAGRGFEGETRALVQGAVSGAKALSETDGRMTPDKRVQLPNQTCGSCKDHCRSLLLSPQITKGVSKSEV